MFSVEIIYIVLSIFKVILNEITLNNASKPDMVFLKMLMLHASENFSVTLIVA